MQFYFYVKYLSVIQLCVLRCLRYMGEYTNCLLQGYGVLPSAPTHVHVRAIGTDYAILYWSTPRTLGDTVTYYNLHYRKYPLSEDDLDEYTSIAKVQSPYILEGLQSDADYEFYVEAVNTHGVGEPSSRLTFKTESKVSQ